jgi:hypothetical protein
MSSVTRMYGSCFVHAPRNCTALGWCTCAHEQPGIRSRYKPGYSDGTAGLPLWVPAALNLSGGMSS